MTGHRGRYMERMKVVLDDLQKEGPLELRAEAELCIAWMQGARGAVSLLASLRRDAVRAVLTGGMNYKEAAEFFGDPSVRTVRRLAEHTFTPGGSK